MNRLYVFVGFFIIIELVNSVPIYENKLFKRGGSRRALTWNFDDIVDNQFYKRNMMSQNRYGVETSMGRRAVVSKNTVRWPDGVIPYDMSNMNADDQQIIRESMDRIMEDTGKNVNGEFRDCITFVEKSPDDQVFVVFQYGDPGVCWANIGYNTRQDLKVTLGDRCVNYNTVQHELMHVIGFHHEQSSPMRDNYVKVYPENIDPNMLDQFTKFNPNDVLNLNIPYDVDSIMQYPEYSFTKQGATGPSMVALDISHKIPPYIIEDRRLSPLDVLSVRRLYQCPT